jgi:hypothetical protein
MQPTVLHDDLGDLQIRADSSGLQWLACAGALLLLLTAASAHAQSGTPAALTIDPPLGSEEPSSLEAPPQPEPLLHDLPQPARRSAPQQPVHLDAQLSERTYANSLSSGSERSGRTAFGLELSLSPELAAGFELATLLTPLGPLPPRSFGSELGPRTIALDRFGFALLGCLGSPSASERGVRVCAGPELTGVFARGRDFTRESASLVGGLDAGLRLDVRMHVAPRWVLTASALLLLASLASPMQSSLLTDKQRAAVQLWLGISYEF